VRLAYVKWRSFGFFALDKLGGCVCCRFVAVTMVLVAATNLSYPDGFWGPSSRSSRGGSPPL
jgi:hypothetical protein